MSNIHLGFYYKELFIFNLMIQFAKFLQRLI